VDVQGLVNLVLGVSSSTPGAGDLNHDGFVNIVDVQILVNTVLGAGVCPA
jgi:hypothetical protein